MFVTLRPFRSLTSASVCTARPNTFEEVSQSWPLQNCRDLVSRRRIGLIGVHPVEGPFVNSFRKVEPNWEEIARIWQADERLRLELVKLPWPLKLGVCRSGCEREHSEEGCSRCFDLPEDPLFEESMDKPARPIPEQPPG